MELNAEVGAHPEEIVKRGEKHTAHAEKPQWNQGLFGKVEFPIQKAAKSTAPVGKGA